MASNMPFGEAQVARPNDPMRWTALLAVSLAVFFVSLDATFWPIAASQIATDLNTDASGIQLVLVLLALVSGPLYLITGPLGELQGRKRLFILGAILYGVSDVVIILAHAFGVLLWIGIPLRGIGQAMLMPMTLGLILANYTQSQRSTAFAARGISVTVAVLAGPLIMGLMADNLNWRGVFAITCASFIPKTDSEKDTVKEAQRHDRAHEQGREKPNSRRMLMSERELVQTSTEKEVGIL